MKKRIFSSFYGLLHKLEDYDLRFFSQVRQESQLFWIYKVLDVIFRLG